MNNWKRFDETSWSDQKAFCSKLKLKEISDEDYKQAQKLFEEFELKNLGEYHDLYVSNYCLQIYLTILKINILKYMKLIMLIFYLHLD